MSRISDFRLYPILSILLIISSQIHAQDQIPETNGAFYAISVENLDETIKWYSDHLQFEVLSRGENDQRKGALLSRPNAILEIAEFTNAVSLEEIKPGAESFEIYGVFKLGFTTNQIDKTFTYLKQKEVEIYFPVVELENGNKTFGIKDPEGNIVQFYGQ